MLQVKWEDMQLAKNCMRRHVVVKVNGKGLKRKEIELWLLFEAGLHFD